MLLERKKPTISRDIEAIVKVTACSICGTDIRTYRFGNKKIDNGRILGHELVGKIESITNRWKENFPEGSYISIAPAIG